MPSQSFFIHLELIKDFCTSIIEGNICFIPNNTFTRIPVIPVAMAGIRKRYTFLEKSCICKMARFIVKSQRSYSARQSCEYLQNSGSIRDGSSFFLNIKKLNSFLFSILLYFKHYLLDPHLLNYICYICTASLTHIGYFNLVFVLCPFLFMRRE